MVIDQEKQQFSARLNELCDEKSVPPKGKARQTILARTFRVTQKGARKWLEAEGFPSQKKGIEIALWGGITYEWLMTGRGPKYTTQEPNQKAAKALQLFERLPEYRRDEALKILVYLGNSSCLDGEKDPAARLRAVRRAAFLARSRYLYYSSHCLPSWGDADGDKSGNESL